MAFLKLTSIGDSTGVVFPREMLERLRVDNGDTILAVETANGYLLTSNDREAERQLGVAQKIMSEYHETLNTLAK